MPTQSAPRDRAGSRSLKTPPPAFKRYRLWWHCMAISSDGSTAPLSLAGYISRYSLKNCRYVFHQFPRVVAIKKIIRPVIQRRGTHQALGQRICKMAVARSSNGYSEVLVSPECYLFCAVLDESLNRLLGISTITTPSILAEPPAIVTFLLRGSRLRGGMIILGRGFGRLIIAAPLWKRKLTHYRTFRSRLGKYQGGYPQRRACRLKPRAL